MLLVLGALGIDQPVEVVGDLFKYSPAGAAADITQEPQQKGLVVWSCDPAQNVQDHSRDRDHLSAAYGDSSRSSPVFALGIGDVRLCKHTRTLKHTHASANMHCNQ